MKALCVTGPEILEELDRPAPMATGSAVVLDVSHCGVCHSDVHFWEGYLDVGAPSKVALTDLGYAMPMVLGHEIVGTVVSVGPDAEGVAVGDRRIAYPWIGCGECAVCRSGQDHLCAASKALGVAASGGFGEQVLVPHPRYLFELGDLDPALACTYACSGLTIYSAVRKLMPVDADEPILIIGAGGLGLSGIAVLHALGHRNIVVGDIGEDKLALASAEGASVTVNVGGEGADARVREAVAGPLRAIVDLVNNPATAALALKLLAKGGKVVQVGLFGGNLPLALMTMPVRAITIQGSFVGSPQEMGEVIALAASGRLKPIPITCHGKADAGRVLTELRDGRVSGRAVLVG